MFSNPCQLLNLLFLAFVKYVKIVVLLAIVTMGIGALAPPGRGDDHPLQFNAEVQSGHSYTLIPPKCLYSMVQREFYLIIIIISNTVVCS